MRTRVIQAVLIVLALLALTFAAIETYLSVLRLVANGRMVTHTLTVLNQINELQSMIFEAETAVRGYALTGDAAFLAPYRSAADGIPAAIGKLRRLTLDRPEQQARLDRLAPILDRKMAQLVRGAANYGDDIQSRRETYTSGKVVSDEIRTVLFDMSALERGLLLTRSGRLEHATRFTLIILLSTVGLAILIIAAVLFVLMRESSRRQRSEAQLKALNEGLEQRIAARTADFAKANDLLTAIITSSPLAIVTLDEHKTITAWNRRAEDMFGVPATKMIGTPWRLLDTIAGIGFARLFARVAAGELITGVAAIDKRPDGRRLSLLVSAAPLYVPEHKRRGVVLIIEDVTERRVVEDQLRQAQKMEAVGQLTGGLAHDFNNLLSIIIGNLTFAGDLVKDQPAEEPVEAALRGAFRGAELTRQLLVFSRQQPLQPREITVADLVTRIAGLLQRSLGEAILVKTVVPPDVWTALADPTQVESAVVNLAINARDAMPDGGKLVIEVRNSTLDLNYSAMNPDVKPGEYVEIAVSDTGVGIPPEILSRVFEPFFTTKPIGRGSGLGLSMIYGFTKQSGGHVKIYSEVGVGTTVRLYLPRARRGLDFERPADGGDGPPHGQGEIILVVEDNDEVRTVASRQLTSLGYQVIEAADGREALTLIRGGAEVDLLFTDVVMPGGLSGPELVREARQLRPDLRVLYTSGFPESSRNGSHPARQDPLLSKPYRLKELARRVAQVLATHRANAAP